MDCSSFLTYDFATPELPPVKTVPNFYSLHFISSGKGYFQGKRHKKRSGESGRKCTGTWHKTGRKPVARGGQRSEKSGRLPGDFRNTGSGGDYLRRV